MRDKGNHGRGDWGGESVTYIDIFRQQLIRQTVLLQKVKVRGSSGEGASCEESVETIENS